MGAERNRVCPVERAGRLDNPLRRLLQNPRRILSPYIREGITVLDLGCGPGFFSIDMARMAGESGRVVASDLQDGMLEKLRNKIAGTPLEKRIVLHRCGQDKIGWPDKVDFILAFYVIHEIPDKSALFREMESMLRPGGRVLVVEPPLHVSKSAFAETLRTARAAGLKPEKGPAMFFNKTAILNKG